MSKRRGKASATARQRKRQQKFAVTLVGVLLLALLSSLFVAFPNFYEDVLRNLGITQTQNVPTTNSSLDVAVHIIDVGQGDAALLEADGEFALIDAGTMESESVILEYLRSAGVTRLEYLFMTHPHADHIGGMQAVVENFEVGEMILPGFGENLPTTSTFEGVLTALLQKNTPTQTAAMGAQFTLGSGIISIIHEGLPESDNYNLLSLGIMFTAGEFSFLNTGDGEKANERAMLESGQNLSADVFMAAHHGSIATSNTIDFISAVMPNVVVISAGAGNSYGHPHTQALENYESVGAKVLRTDEAGHVVVKPGEHGGIVWGTSR